MSFTIPDTYELVKSEFIEDLGFDGYILRHKMSGARVCLLPCDDTNKLFCIAFATPPEDSKGTPHIIEHTVLCGSEKYPSRDPFMQLVKGSLHTFINAMTYPDKTMYPVSSCNDADFRILTDVYLDAVFRPNIYRRPEIFMQEGWHYETDGGDSPLTVNGVVYSEMKGKSSSPDSNVFDELLYTIFPDSVYGRCSGGEPADILSLSREEYLDFHRRHYDPSNSYIMFYGDIDPEERLDYLDREYLSTVAEGEKTSFFIGQQPRFGKGNVRMRRVAYPVGTDEDDSSKTYLAWGSLTCDASDETECAAWEILGEVLVNDPAAPVKRALTDAGIGQEIYGGFLNHMKEPVFSVIAKNTDEDRTEEFLSIIKETFRAVRDGGLNRRAVRAFIERSEFKFRENAYGSYPRGLDLFKNMLQSWIYTEDDPFRYLRVLKILGELKERLEEGYFESLAGKLIDTDHESVTVLVPEKGLAEKEDKALADKLEAFRRDRTDDELRRIKEDFDSLRSYQEAPETDEEKNCVPTLPRGSISPEPEPLFNRETTLCGVPAVIHDINTNGIVYLRLLFDITDVPAEDLPIVDLLIESMGKVDTLRTAYADLVDDVRLTAGGLDFDTALFRKKNSRDEFTAYLSVSLRVLGEKTAHAIDLLKEIISESSFSDPARVREIFDEMMSAKSRDILYSGHEFASDRCLAYIDPYSAFNDSLDGLGSYFRQTAMLKEFEEGPEPLLRDLERLRCEIFSRSRLTVSLAAESGDLPAVERGIGSLVKSLPEGSRRSHDSVINPLGLLNEAFSSASQVQYVAAASCLPDQTRLPDPGMALIDFAVSGEVLYPEVRLKGGAYGCSCTINSSTGLVLFRSYRDPNLSSTLDVYRSAGELLKSLKIDDEKLWQLIIGTYSRILRPLSPFQKMYRSFYAYATGKTLDEIREDRKKILGMTVRDVEERADLLSRAMENCGFCVIGGEGAIDKDRAMFGSVKKVFE
ncbi:MAG: insulinase family protein [Clostridia bacterium]|nr:insulinase family protein [Clostridia bacterium]